MADIIGGHGHRRNPEDLRACELSLGHPDTGLRGGHDQRPGIGKPQGGGQVDRKAEVGGLVRRGFEPRDLTSKGEGPPVSRRPPAENVVGGIGGGIDEGTCRFSGRLPASTGNGVAGGCKVTSMAAPRAGQRAAGA